MIHLRFNLIDMFLLRSHNVSQILVMVAMTVDVHVNQSSLRVVVAGVVS